jgi:hypothetical protein
MLRHRAPLVLAGIVVAPVVAFAFIWATLLLMLGITWVLDATGFL